MKVAAAGMMGAVVVVIAARKERSICVVAVGERTMVGGGACMARHFVAPMDFPFFASGDGGSVGVGDSQERRPAILDVILERSPKKPVCVIVSCFVSACAGRDPMVGAID